MENDRFLPPAQGSFLRIHPHRRHRSILPRLDPAQLDPDRRLRVELHILHNPRSRLCLRRCQRGRRRRIQDTFRSALLLPPEKISNTGACAARAVDLRSFSYYVVNLTLASLILQWHSYRHRQGINLSIENQEFDDNSGVVIL